MTDEAGRERETVRKFTRNDTVPTGWAQKSDDAEHAELAKALRDAKISLQRGLTASTKEGKPFRRSAKWSTESSNCPSTQ